MQCLGVWREENNVYFHHVLLQSTSPKGHLTVDVACM